MNPENLDGKFHIINMMTFLGYNLSSKGAFMESKLCPGCNQLLLITQFSKDKSRKDGYRRKCKACSSQEFKKFQTTEGYVKRLKKQLQIRHSRKESTPIKHWAYVAFHNAKARAKKQGITFDLTKEWLETNAPTHCPLLEIELIYDADKSLFNSASIDRVNSFGGYTEDNCKIISFKANRIKSNATLDELELLVRNMRNY